MANFKNAFAFFGITLLVTASSLTAQEISDIADLVKRDSSPLDRSAAGLVVSYSESLKEARPAVVSVYAKSLETALKREDLRLEDFFGMRPRRQPTPRMGLGSGVIVTDNGYIVTNNHVVSRADEIQVQLDNGKIYDAKLIGADPQTDIAVIKIESDDPLPSIQLTDSDQIEIGDIVFAIGNPLGLGKTVTMGIVSATRRQAMRVIENGFENFIQTDAPINSGNSGGALVDAKGRLIGINTLIQTDGMSTGNIGIGFAVPVNLVYSVMLDLITSGSVSRGYLGVGIDRLDDFAADYFGVGLQGALVNQVKEGSPAAEADLRTGDVITEVNGVTIDSPEDLRVRIAARKPGEKVTLVFVRDKQIREVQVTLAKRESEIAIVSPISGSAPKFLEGVSVAVLDDSVRAEFELDDSVVGIVVTDVAADSAYAALLPVGMVIQKINGNYVNTVEEAAGALQRGQKNMLLINYRGANRWIGIEVD